VSIGELYLRQLTGDNRGEVIQVGRWPSWLKAIVLAFLKWFLEEIGKEASKSGGELGGSEGPDKTGGRGAGGGDSDG